VHDSAPQDSLSEREEFETHLIMTLLHNYYAIVRRNLIDTVPKACMHFLVNAVMEQLPARLVSELYREELFGELLREDEQVAGLRARCRAELDALQEAMTVLLDVRQTALNHIQ
jgi:dynamin 1-like protein